MQETTELHRHRAPAEGTANPERFLIALGRLW